MLCQIIPVCLNAYCACAKSCFICQARRRISGRNYTSIHNTAKVYGENKFLLGIGTNSYSKLYSYELSWHLYKLQSRRCKWGALFHAAKTICCTSYGSLMGHPAKKIHTIPLYYLYGRRKCNSHVLPVFLLLYDTS